MDPSSSPSYVRLNSDPAAESRGRARKGYVPVLVGKDEVMERVNVPTKLMEHPYIVGLLEMAASEYGYHQDGLLKIPYDANSFKVKVKKLSKQSGDGKYLKRVLTL